MKLKNIKKGMFYTDGEKLYSKIDGVICVWLHSQEELGWTLKKGNCVARISAEDEVKNVKLVKPEEVFYDGEMKVVSETVVSGIEIHPINPVYDSKGYCVKHDGYETENVFFNSESDLVTENGKRRYSFK